MRRIHLSIHSNINHWARALRLIGAPAPEVQASASTSIELTDDLFDEPESDPGETEWFQIDGRRFEVFIDDGVSTVRLANRLVVRDLHGGKESPLVSWFGYRADEYELESHASETVSAPSVGAFTRIAWIGWDLRAWRTHLFDGTRLMPITPSSPLVSECGPNAHKAAWAGWDFECMDFFTTELPQTPAAAVLVGTDDSVLVVHHLAHA